MDRHEVEAFVRREWDRSATLKAAHWSQQFRNEGWRRVWDAAQLLLAHVRLVRPDFPADSDRERDFAHHLALTARLDRAAHAFSRR